MSNSSGPRCGPRKERSLAGAENGNSSWRCAGLNVSPKWENVEPDWTVVAANHNVNTSPNHFLGSGQQVATSSRKGKAAFSAEIKAFGYTNYLRILDDSSANANSAGGRYADAS